MAVRLFTHGYDLYAPREMVCYHLWSRAHRPKAVNTQKQDGSSQKEKLKASSQIKVKKQLLEDSTTIGGRYGLGIARTASTFADKLGVYFSNQSFSKERSWKNGDLQSEDFAADKNASESVFPEDSVEAKIFTLDSKAQALIGMFLQGIPH
jgi:[Skp1-protein]-hydroxyproline N-acetylglucosaminyltransferase